LEFVNFQTDILASIGEPPPDAVFARIDKNRDYVPDNVCWKPICRKSKKENQPLECIRDI
jgi:hypothetical protein